MDAYPWRSGYRKIAFIVYNPAADVANQKGNIPVDELDKAEALCLCEALQFTDIYLIEDKKHQEIITSTRTVIDQEKKYKECLLPVAEAVMAIVISLGSTKTGCEPQWLAAQDEWYPLSHLKNILCCTALMNKPKIIVTHAGQRVYDKHDPVHRAINCSKPCVKDTHLQKLSSRTQSDYVWFSSTSAKKPTLHSFGQGSPYLTNLRANWDNISDQPDLVKQHQAVEQMVAAEYQVHFDGQGNPAPSVMSNSLTRAISPVAPKIHSQGIFPLKPSKKWNSISLEKALTESNDSPEESALTAHYTLIIRYTDGSELRQQIIKPDGDSQQLQLSDEAAPKKKALLFPVIMRTIVSTDWLHH